MTDLAIYLSFPEIQLKNLFLKTKTINYSI